MASSLRANVAGGALRQMLPQLVSGRLRRIHINKDLDICDKPSAECRGIVFPGFFDPLHEGHFEMGRAAMEKTKRPLLYELSVTNVDKPPLPVEVVEERAEQFRGRAECVLTSAPRFIDKARLFPGCSFLIGADTASRLVMPQYYQNDKVEMERAMDEMRSLGCSFLVAARLVKGKFETLETLLPSLPQQYSPMFIPVGSKTRFHWLSSW